MQSFPNSLTTPDQVIPIPGMGATIVYHSDRHPAKVVRVSPSGKSCWISIVPHTLVSGSCRTGDDQYEFGEVEEGAAEIRVSKTKKGWQRAGGGNIWLDRQEKYIDPSF